MNSLVLRLDVINSTSLYSYFLNIYLCFHSNVCDLICVYFLDDLTTHLISLVCIELEDWSQTMV